MAVITHVVGARPNFMKAAPVMAAIKNLCPSLQQKLVHTGQHYDANMSDVFFAQLGMPLPDANLEVGSGPRDEQITQIMERFEAWIGRERPDMVVVYGDVNSTVAAAQVSAKAGIPVAHVEAGLRSFDRSMPEELNRVATDQLASLLFTPSPDGDANLLREGIAAEKIFRVGNVMIDTLQRLRPEATRRWPKLRDEYLKVLSQDSGADLLYALVTLHRPSNVDDPRKLIEMMHALDEIAEHVAVFFPVHPRTKKKIDEAGFVPRSQKLRLADPVGYLEFLALQEHAALVITDSGGIQEETTFLGVPCFTLRENTERPSRSRWERTG